MPSRGQVPCRLIDIQHLRDIHARFGNKEPKRSADSWIHVQQLVLPVSLVVAEIHVHSALVAERSQEFDRDCLQSFVMFTNPEAGDSDIPRVLPQFPSRKCGKTL